MAHDEWRQQLRVAVAHDDAAAIARLLDVQLPGDGLQHSGDAVLCALAADPPTAVDVAVRVVDALRTRAWGGDEELADAIDVALGRRPTTLALLDLDLELLADALIEPPGSIGYLDLHAGVVVTEEMLDFGGQDDDMDLDDRSRRLPVPGEGSDEPYRDMQHFIATVTDLRLAQR